MRCSRRSFKRPGNNPPHYYLRREETNHALCPDVRIVGWNERLARLLEHEPQKRHHRTHRQRGRLPHVPRRATRQGGWDLSEVRDEGEGIISIFDFRFWICGFCISDAIQNSQSKIQNHFNSSTRSIRSFTSRSS